jgi:hypothetical protein
VFIYGSKYLSTENHERYQLDTTIMIYYQKLSLHVSGIYMPIFRGNGLYVTAYGAQHCERELGVNGWSCSVLFFVFYSAEHHMH